MTIGFEGLDNPLDSEEVESFLLQTIAKIIQQGLDRNSLPDPVEVNHIEILPLDNVEGRLINVVCDPKEGLIGTGGVIAKSIRDELVRKFGGRILFNVVNPKFERSELEHFLRNLIDNEIPNKPDNFHIEKISFSTHNKEGKDRAIYIKSEHVGWLNGIDGIHKLFIVKSLSEKFGGRFYLSFPRGKAPNLRNEDVEKALLKFIDENREVWEVEPEFVIFGIIARRLDGVSGRSLKIHCSRPKALIGSQGKIAKEIEAHLSEKFQPPFTVRFIGQHEDLDKEEISAEVKHYFSTKLEIVCPDFSFNHIDGSKNRVVQLIGNTTISDTEISELKDYLEDKFGKPIKVRKILR